MPILFALQFCIAGKKNKCFFPLCMAKVFGGKISGGHGQSAAQENQDMVKLKIL